MFGLVYIIKVFLGFLEMFLVMISHTIFLLLGRHCEWYCSRAHFYLALIHPQVRWWWKTLFSKYTCDGFGPSYCVLVWFLHVKASLPPFCLWEGWSDGMESFAPSLMVLMETWKRKREEKLGFFLAVFFIELYVTMWTM